MGLKGAEKHGRMPVRLPMDLFSRHSRYPLNRMRKRGRPIRPERPLNGRRGNQTRKCRGTPLFPVFSLPRASGQALSDIGENIDKCFVPRIISFIIAYPIEKYKRLQAFDDTESLLFYCISGTGGGFCFIVPQSPPKVNVFSADTRPPFFPAR